MNDAVPLMKFLARCAGERGGHIYVVGGAVRNSIMNLPVKDIDVVVDSIALNDWTSADFAGEIQRAIPVRSSLVTNQYGVAILTISEDWELDGQQMRGEVIEIANARKESYGGASGKGYKPHLVERATIEDDLARRDFSMNCLLWRLSDLHGGPDEAEVLDLLGCGAQDLVAKMIRTPRDPDVTFTDDPTRMLRAIKFAARYGFLIDLETRQSIIRNADGLKRMPWDAVRKILIEDILFGPRPLAAIWLMEQLGLLGVLKELMSEPGMRAAMNRAMPKLDPVTYITILDKGFDVQTPLSFLSVEERAVIKTRVARGNDETAALIRPPVNSKSIFDAFAIPLPERGAVLREARRAILADFALASDPAALQAATEARIGAMYARM